MADSSRPAPTPEHVTERVAADFAELAAALRQRGLPPLAAAHFLMKCTFCLFAEDVAVLPDHPFRDLLKRYPRDGARLKAGLDEMFDNMRTDGALGVDARSLLDESPALELRPEEIATLLDAATQDWARIEPAIFGTLFERSLNPRTRAKIGAHYTRRDDIMLVVEPVILDPLRREWAALKSNVETQLKRRRAADKKLGTTRSSNTTYSEITALLNGFVDRLSSVSILDPACGSGNFLYVALQQLLELENEVIGFAARPEIASPMFPRVRPKQLHGIEINPYAAELAQVVIWIGYLQRMRGHGFVAASVPILEPIRTIENRDAILDGSMTDAPSRAKWPDAHFIIGNPPFLGSKLFRQNGLDDAYIKAIHAAYDLPKTSDLCCYWFEQARRAVCNATHREDDSSNDGSHNRVRVGFIATQGIRGGDNRTVLKRIKDTGDIFFAWPDREWVLDGAKVRVSIVGFDGGHESRRHVSGKRVSSIHSDLTIGGDLTASRSLTENSGIAYMGDTKGGKFDIEHTIARAMLGARNPDDTSNARVLPAWINGSDLTQRNRGMHIVDFGCDTPLKKAAQFESPFAWVESHVRQQRSTNRRKSYAEKWWIHVEPRPTMRTAIGAGAYIATPNVTKFRIFKRIDSATLADHQLIAFARSDDYFLGVLHSAIHELWARRMGTQLREAESGFRYTPTTCFETFPLPWAPGSEPVDHPAHRAIGEAAHDLCEQRERWLNPPEWIEPIAAAVDAEDDFADVPEDARRRIRRSVILARAARDQRLRKRTLTNLYNERPIWLCLAHHRLDGAVLAAYAAVDPNGEWRESWADAWRDLGAARSLPNDHDLAESRAKIDQTVLANLLRLNLARAEAQGSR